MYVSNSMRAAVPPPFSNSGHSVQSCCTIASLTRSMSFPPPLGLGERVISSLQPLAPALGPKFLLVDLF